MDILLYLTIPILGIALWIIFTRIVDDLLAKKKDNLSRIKSESRKVHYEEDHNIRLTKQHSIVFWKSQSNDLGIREKLRNRVKEK